MNKKTIIALLMTCVGFSAVRAKDGKELDKQQKLLESMGRMLEQHHYLSPVINDDFSKSVWKDYLNSLDIKKNILLQADITQLKKYEKYLDNEMHGDSLKFFPQVINSYTTRCAEVSLIYRHILARPFTFSKADLVDPGLAPKDFPKDSAERINRWESSLKYLTLQKLTALQEQRAEIHPGQTADHKTDKQLELEARQFLLTQYDRVYARVSSASRDKLFSNYLNVITRSIDPHSDYLAPVEKKRFDEKMGSLVFGIGVQLSESNGAITMIYYAPGGPASRSGVFSINDQLIKIGQGDSRAMADVTGMETEDVVNLIRGEKGTTVRIGYKKSDGSHHTVSLVRAEVKQEDALARSAVIEKKGKKIGYIHLPVFYEDAHDVKGAHCAEDVAAQLTQLQVARVDGLVIDLRFNGGGSLNEVVKMVGLFIGRGPVVQIKGSRGNLEILESRADLPMYTGPLTVLVNEFSASASEIFAGAIQDYHRGLIIGSRTFGKGTVQTTAPLGREDEGVLKLTVSQFYRVEGGSTQQKGVIPDIVLPDEQETGKYHEGDLPFALSWDRIPRATYGIMNMNLDSLARLAEVRVDQNPAFSAIKRNNIWLEDHPDTETQVTVAAYQTTLSARKSIRKQNEAVQKLAAIERMEVQASQITTDEKGPYNEWLKKIAADLYIKEAFNITLDMTN